MWFQVVFGNQIEIIFIGGGGRGLVKFPALDCADSKYPWIFVESYKTIMSMELWRNFENN